MRIYLVTFGKLRTPGLREAADYFKRNVGAWTELEEIELKPLHVADKSPATRTVIQREETKILSEKLARLLSPRGKLYLLDEGGKALSTAKWAELVENWESGSIPEVAICVGSSLGFGKEIRDRAAGILSLGPQTLSHELARVVILEQIYRAFSVNRGHPYHHAN